MILLIIPDVDRHEDAAPELWDRREFFALIDVQFVLRQAPISITIARNGPRGPQPLGSAITAPVDLSGHQQGIILIRLCQSWAIPGHHR